MADGSKAEPFLSSGDVEAQVPEVDHPCVELSAWKRDGEEDKKFCEVFQTEKEWGAGMGLSSSDDDSDAGPSGGWRARRGVEQPVVKKVQVQSPQGVGDADVGIVQVSGEWAGMAGLSDSDSEPERGKSPQKAAFDSFDDGTTVASTMMINGPGPGKVDGESSLSRSFGIGRGISAIRVPKCDAMGLRFVVVSTLSVFDFPFQVASMRSLAWLQCSLGDVFFTIISNSISQIGWSKPERTP
jgi:hypothetical protein